MLEVFPAQRIVDVTGIAFIDSAGADPLLRAQRSAAERHATVELRGHSPALTRLLDGLDRVRAAGREREGAL